MAVIALAIAATPALGAVPVYAAPLSSNAQQEGTPPTCNPPSAYNAVVADYMNKGFYEQALKDRYSREWHTWDFPKP